MLAVCLAFSAVEEVADQMIFQPKLRRSTVARSRLIACDARLPLAERVSAAVEWVSLSGAAQNYEELAPAAAQAIGLLEEAITESTTFEIPYARIAAELYPLMLSAAGNTDSVAFISLLARDMRLARMASWIE
jgi:hypothetical protein